MLLCPCSGFLCILLWFLRCGAVFFFKQKTAYEMRISDWSSDVCSSDLLPASYALVRLHNQLGHMTIAGRNAVAMIDFDQIAITSGPSGPADDAVRSGIDRSADWSGNIEDRKSTRLNSSH